MSLNRTSKPRCTSNPRITFVIGTLCIALAACIIVLFAHFAKSALPQNPNPDSFVQPFPFDFATDVSSNRRSPYEAVDWGYWQRVNPDVIGWICIPGTNVNAPVVQAHADDPDHYLLHDVFGNYNPFGAIFLDADCEDRGFDSDNAVVLGHGIRGMPNIGFGTLPEYTNRDFASAHMRIVVQTPTRTYDVEPRYMNVVPGWVASKRTDFENRQDFRLWYESNKASAHLVVDDSETVPDHVITLVTCSYFHWADNERTVVSSG